MSRRDELVAFYRDQGWMVRTRPALTPLQTRLVCILADGRAHSASDLARALELREDSVAHLVARLRRRFGRGVVRSQRNWGYWLARPLA